MKNSTRIVTLGLAGLLSLLTGLPGTAYSAGLGTAKLVGAAMAGYIGGTVINSYGGTGNTHGSQVYGAGADGGGQQDQLNSGVGRVYGHQGVDLRTLRLGAADRPPDLGAAYNGYYPVYRPTAFVPAATPAAAVYSSVPPYRPHTQYVLGPGIAIGPPVRYYTR